MMDALQQILVYYAILCLCMMPISIIVMVHMYKKGLLKRFDAWLDSIIEPNAKKEEPKPEPEPEPEEEEKDVVDEAVEKAKNFGIASFSLQVGDKYTCRLGYASRRNIFGAIEWISGNKFVGDIDKDGLFTSNKAGQVRLFFHRAGDNNDPEAAAYDITVHPTNPSWFAQKILDFVLSGRKMTDVYIALQDRKSIVMVPAKKIAEYEGVGTDERKLVLQSNGANNLVRAYYEIKNTEKNLDDLVSELQERFEHIATEGNIEIWAHCIKDDEKDIVDAYAWTKIGKNRNILFGIGQIWRDECEKEEFLMNIQMAEKMFADLTGDEPLTVVKATEEELKKMEEETKAPKKETPSVPAIPAPAKEPEHKEPKAEQEKETNKASEDNKPEETQEGQDAPEGSVSPDDLPSTEDIPDESEQKEGDGDDVSEIQGTVDFDDFPDEPVPQELNNEE